MSGSVASWSGDRFLKGQVGWSGIHISWRISHSSLWSTQSKALALPIKQMFFWKFLAFSMIQRMLAIWPLVPLPFLKSSLNIWKFMVHVLLKPGLENFEHYFTSVWDECNHVVVWAFFGTAFLWDWDENWPFPVLWPLLSFPDLLACWVQLGQYRTLLRFRWWYSGWESTCQRRFQCLVWEDSTP